MQTWFSVTTRVPTRADHRDIVEYDWDYDTGLATLVYEDPETKEETAVVRQQLRFWVPPRWRMPVRTGPGNHDSR